MEGAGVVAYEDNKPAVIGTAVAAGGNNTVAVAGMADQD